MCGHEGWGNNVLNPVEKGQDPYTARVSCRCLLTLKDLKGHYSALDMLIRWSECGIYITLRKDYFN